MSVIGRLWRRAPAWRMCIAVAVACTALAAMFPPALPRPALSRAMLPRWAGGSGDASTGSGAGTQAGQAGPAGGARYVPQPQPALPDTASVELPPLAPGREALVAEAGRLLPLPAGSWQLVAFGRVDGARATQVSLLDRVEAGRLTGLLLVAAQVPLAAAGGPVGVPPLCVAPDALARQVATPAQAERSAQDLVAHECWTVSASDTAGLAASGDTLVRHGLERLATMHVAVPDHMLAVRFLRSDRTGWMLATVFLPDRRAGSPGALRRVEEWAGRFARLFHRGYDGALTAADVAAGRGAEE